MYRFVVTFFCLLLTGCGSEQRPIHVQMATPKPTPLPYKLLEGSAFVEGEQGAKHLAGICIQLLDSNRFEEQVFPLRNRFITRQIYQELYNCDQEIRSKSQECAQKQASIQRELEQWGKLLNEKEDELTRFKDVKWSEFLYVDPINGQQVKGSYFDGHTLLLMDKNVSLLKGKIKSLRSDIYVEQQKLSSAIDAFEQRKDQLCNRLRNVNTNFVSNETEKKQAVHFIASIGGPENVVTVNANDIIKAINNVTVDQVNTGAQGDFSFKVPHDNQQQYLCYACYGGLSWLVAVQDDPYDPERCRKIIITRNNSINMSNLAEKLKVLNMQTSVGDWINN